MLSESELVKESDNALCVLSLNAVGLLKESHLPHAVFYTSLHEILADLNRHVVASLVIFAKHNLTESAPAKLFYCLIAVGEMIALNDLIESGSCIVSLIVNLVDVASASSLATVPSSLSVLLTILCGLPVHDSAEELGAALTATITLAA